MQEFRHPRFKEYSVRRPQIWVHFQYARPILCYCTLYSDCPYGKTDAVARHASFSQITCCGSFQP